jgi:hypothetical protein
MGWLVSGTIDGIPKNILNKFPKIKSICSLVDEHSEIFGMDVTYLSKKLSQRFF